VSESKAYAVAGRWPRLLRPTEAAAYLGLSQQALEDLERREPDFPRSKDFCPDGKGRGRIPRYDREAVDRWISDQFGREQELDAAARQKAVAVYESAHGGHDPASRRAR